MICKQLFLSFKHFLLVFIKSFSFLYLNWSLLNCTSDTRSLYPKDLVSLHWHRRKHLQTMLPYVEFSSDPFHWHPHHLVGLLYNWQVYFIKRLKSQYFSFEYPLRFQYAYFKKIKKSSIHYFLYLSSWQTPLQYKYHIIHFRFQMAESENGHK